MSTFATTRIRSTNNPRLFSLMVGKRSPSSCCGLSSNSYTRRTRLTTTRKRSFPASAAAAAFLLLSSASGRNPSVETVFVTAPPPTPRSVGFAWISNRNRDRYNKNAIGERKSAFTTTTTTTAAETTQGGGFANSHHQSGTGETMSMSDLKKKLSSIKVWEDAVPIEPTQDNLAKAAESSSASGSPFWVLDQCMLPLSSTTHKGTSGGRVAVLGGNGQYTGAPFYAAMSSLQAGADLSYVFTAQEASLPLKCYSPEIMVSTVYSATEFDDMVAKGNTTNTSTTAEIEAAFSREQNEKIDEMVHKVTSMMERFHCLIVGPGLGRCPMVMEAASKILGSAVQNNVPLVIDADALYMLSLPRYRHVLRGYDRVVLTPNVVEYKRLFPAQDDQVDEDFASALVIRKGRGDVIFRGRQTNGEGDGPVVMTCQEEGGMKRSGGIGDVLAGTVGTLIAWQNMIQSEEKKKKKNSKKTQSNDNATSNEEEEQQDSDTNATKMMLSCWVACCFVKRATKIAFEEKRRSMTAPDVLNSLPKAIRQMTGEY